MSSPSEWQQTAPSGRLCPRRVDGLVMPASIGHGQPRPGAVTDALELGRGSLMAEPTAGSLWPLSCELRAPPPPLALS